MENQFKRYICKSCHSSNLVKHGFIKKQGALPVQRYKCMDCGYKSEERIDSLTNFGSLMELFGWRWLGQQFEKPVMDYLNDLQVTLEEYLKSEKPKYQYWQHGMWAQWEKTVNEVLSRHIKDIEAVK